MANSIPITSNLNLLLIGKTGNGKSSTGNSIVMRDGVFQASSRTKSETKTAAADYTEFNGFDIKVVDTPGVCDTCLSQEQCYQMVTNAAIEAMKYSPEGYHAILIVLKYGNRYTKEEQESIEALMKLLGNDFIGKHGIILMTNGDGLKKDELSFEDFTDREKNGNKNFNTLLALCENRIIIFNNKLWPKNSDNLEKQMKKIKLLQDQNQRLINIIIENKLHLKPYTEEKFESAQKERDQLMLEFKAPMFKEKMKKQTAAILRKINLAEFDPLDERAKKIEQALREKDILENELKEEGKGTDALAEAEKIVADIGNYLYKDKRMCQEERKLKQEMDELKRTIESMKKEQQNLDQKIKKEELRRQIENEKREKEIKEQQRILAEKREKERKEKEKVEADYQRYKKKEENSGIWASMGKRIVNIFKGFLKIWDGVKQIWDNLFY